MFHIPKKITPILVISLVIAVIGITIIQLDTIQRKITVIDTNIPVKKSENTSSQYTQINPTEFKKIAEEKNATIIDVHTPQQEHIFPSDLFIPYTQIKENVQKLPTDKNTPIIVYCRSGGMSPIAAKALNDLGYTTVYELEGGIENYKSVFQDEVAVTPIQQDLGEVIYGEIATTQFTLKNQTADKIEITRLSTSCGCTKATAEKMKLTGYDETTITVTFNPAIHKDDTDLGEITRTIYIETNSSSNPTFEVDITANVVKK